MNNIKNQKPIKLEQTVDLMNNEDYKERFRAEYFQLTIRIEGLFNMLCKYKNNTLPFTPSCSFDLLNGQLKAMNLYKEYLKERAVIEGINLN